MEKQTILNAILTAREDRSKLRREFALKKLANLSLTFNIPGYPKSNSLITKCYEFVLSDLYIFLQSRRISIDSEISYNKIDAAGNFHIVALTSKLPLSVIKSATEEFEITHELNRLIDVDIFDIKAEPISSGKQKKCLICKNKKAIQCIRAKAHTPEELQRYIHRKLQKFSIQRKNKQIIHILTENAIKSVLFEVSHSPKPGLVDFYNSGVHSDMDFNTFIASSSALAIYWTEFAEAGIKYKGELENVLNIIRPIGLRAEQAMFLATNNINTQKGIIFSLGLMIFTSAYILKKSDNLNIPEFRKIIRGICKDLVEKEMTNKHLLSDTNGKKTFKKYGKQGAGARQQAQEGFPIIFEEILPFLLKNTNEYSFSKQTETKIILNKVLLKIISILDDTNILYRSDIKTANKLKEKAYFALKDDKNYAELEVFCKTNNISPGGAADILAASLFYYFTAKKFN